ncbi:DUF4180 domain-containing protein [bacterium]|nr:DUF4180 domain-containing protein [bacterium]
MEPTLRTINDKQFLDVPAESLRIASERDALDLVGLCGEHQVQNVVIAGECLDDAFFDLKTGLAGAALLKWSNYLLRVAVILPPERIGTGRFAEFVMETNRGNQFRVFSDKESAVKWLVH